jgi:hypothetical protein
MLLAVAKATPRKIAQKTRSALIALATVPSAAQTPRAKQNAGKNAPRATDSARDA